MVQGALCWEFSSDDYLPVETTMVRSLFILVFLLSGCGGPTNPSGSSTSSDASPQSLITAKPLTVRIAAKNDTLFRRMPAAETNIGLVHRFPTDAPIERMTDQYSGSGVCIGDIDADGLPDIYITNYDQGNHLYRNLGGFRFEDVTQTAGVSGDGCWSAGATFVDVDNDHDLDLFVCVFNAPNLMYVNRGNGVFDEQSRQRGLDYSGASVMMAFADYDLDGDLDGYLVTHRMNIGEKFRMPRSTSDAFRRGIIARMPDGKNVRVTQPFRELFQLMDRGQGRVELVIAGQRDYLYRNEGAGRFRVVNRGAGITGHGIGLAASWWDYNDDGLPDLYVSNDYKGADQLYQNQGDGTFADVARSALPHVPWFSMGSASADINNDGRIDLLATDMSGTDHYKQKLAMGDMEKDLWFLRISNPQQYMRNALYLNTGTSRVMEIAHLAGVANTDWTWSPLFGDLDNDGWVDLFVANGMSRDYMNSDLATTIEGKQSTQWLMQPVRREANLAFRNNGELRFDEMASSWGLDQVSASYGAAMADLDRDGDLDLVVANFEEQVSVYQNDEDRNRRLLVRLIGTTSNRWGIGSRVEVETKTSTQTQWLSACQGFMSSSEPIVQFGLGEEARVRRLTVAWPSGEVQTFSNLAADRLYSIGRNRLPANGS